MLLHASIIPFNEHTLKVLPMRTTALIKQKYSKELSFFLPLFRLNWIIVTNSVSFYSDLYIRIFSIILLAWLISEKVLWFEYSFNSPFLGNMQKLIYSNQRPIFLISKFPVMIYFYTSFSICFYHFGNIIIPHVFSIFISSLCQFIFW